MGGTAAECLGFGMQVLGLSASRQLALARISDMLTLSVTDDRLEVRTEARITTPGKVTFAKNGPINLTWYWE